MKDIKKIIEDLTTSSPDFPEQDINFQKTLQEAIDKITQAYDDLKSLGFNDKQIDQIMEGPIFELNTEQILVYAKLNLSAEKMDFIKQAMAGYYNGKKTNFKISIEQAKMLANPKLSLPDMQKMYLNFKAKNFIKKYSPPRM